MTIDGTKGAVQGIVDGWISGVIESNPRFGPLAFKALADFYGGDRRPGQDHHLRQGVHEGQRSERAAQRLLSPRWSVPVRLTKASSWVMRAGTDSCHYRPMRIG